MKISSKKKVSWFSTRFGKKPFKRKPEQSLGSCTSDSLSSEVDRPTLVRVSSLLSGSAHHDTPIDFDSDDDSLTNQLCSLELESSIQKTMSGKQESTSQEIKFTKPDVYGQEHPIETPELIASKLVAFEKEVAKIPKHKKKALLEAMAKCPHLIDDQFKLMFLRCEVFCEKSAAKRFAKYWDLRLQIFGPDKAFMPLTQEHALNEEDKFALSLGYVTIIKSRDFAGRHICYGNPERQQIGAYPTASSVRAVWYIVHKALEDEDSQKRGIVFVADLRPSRLAHFDPELVRLVAVSAQGALPIRISALHGCSPPRIFHVVFPVIKAMMGERLRKRVRLHGGSIESVQDELAKYGLPMSVLPDEIGGETVIDHRGWLLEMRRMEEGS